MRLEKSRCKRGRLMGIGVKLTGGAVREQVKVKR